MPEVTSLLETANGHVSSTGLALVAVVMSSKPEWMNFPEGQYDANAWGASARETRDVPEVPDSDPLEQYWLVDREISHVSSVIASICKILASVFPDRLPQCLEGVRELHRGHVYAVQADVP